MVRKGARMTDWPESYDRRVLAEVDSTNAEAARMATELTGPTWIMARNQTAARGRRGRGWANPAGNFAATLVLHPSEPPEQAALRSFVASLALYDGIVAATGRAQGLSLKWPNDVLLNGGKLAGILLESAGHGPRLSHLAIGIGVNLRNARMWTRSRPARCGLFRFCPKPVPMCRRRSSWAFWRRPMPGTRRSSRLMASAPSVPRGWIARRVWVRSSRPARHRWR